MESVYIAIFVSVFVGVLVFFVASYFVKRKKMQEAIQKFEREMQGFDEWLQVSGIRKSKVLGGYQCCGFNHVEGLIIDMENRKWCKQLTDISFEFSEIAGVDIDKRFARETNGISDSKRSGTSVGYRQSSVSARKSSGSTSRNSYRTTQDVSTYSVLIKTNRLSNSLVTIPCGQDREAAENIKATVKNMIAESKKIENQLQDETKE